MKKIIFFSLILPIVLIILNCKRESNSNKQIISQAFEHAHQQSRKAIAQCGGDSLYLPASLKEDGSLRTTKASGWVSGFFPGVLWLEYEYSKDDFWLENARKWTDLLENQQYNTRTHDVGFMMYCSYGNGYRLTSDPEYQEIIIQSARSLSSRFNPTVGCIKSWDWSNKWQFPVIIDNMMNLELLFMATKLTGDSTFSNIAVSHALTTMKNHFRDDFSSYHVVDYDTITGKAIWKGTHQGYNDASAWSRGQAWGLYGYMICFRETGNIEFLKMAKKIAEYVLNHPSLPEDKIPYWDFDAPQIPDTPRDASAGAIIGSALISLYDLDNRNERYLEAGSEMLSNLFRDYTIHDEESIFILDHSTGYFNAGSEVDVPIIYADYYYLDGLLKWMKLNDD